ncbi:FUSC family protein [Gordonia sp. NB41Y]|uniref:FUSC family protein n=1 Tax=Gordonia sp. NB41Y TaxID=875808 RepID=UPI0006B1482B|nr:FUSC family protein [Gordonia sp. NB41Y]WLP88936.1 FUSC family protein [Gordonia sp. NB41Y]
MGPDDDPGATRLRMMRGHLTPLWHATVSFGPRGRPLGAATRAAIGLAVPLTVLVAADRLEWALYAGFGAFAAVYGRYDDHRKRMWVQLGAGTAIVVSMLLGTLLSYLDAPLIVRAAVIGVVAAVVAHLSFGLGWTPPGAIFAVFGGGACASVPATAASFAAAAGVGAATVGFSVLVVIGLGLREMPLRDFGGRPPGWDPPPTAGTAALVMGVTAFLGGLAAIVALSGHWYWASVAALTAVTGQNTYFRLARGVQRLAGTVVGVLVVGVLFLVGTPTAVLLVLAVICQAAVELCIQWHYAIASMFITLAALIMVDLAAPQPPGGLITDRLMETLIGVGVGCAVALASAAATRLLGPTHR